ncbi:MAG: alpha/beta family hydrolase [Acidobacteriota bacterium]
MDPVCKRFSVGEKGDVVSALYLSPKGARRLLVLGHGAGAGMRHPFLEKVSQELAQRGMATLRYQFPYMEHRLKRPDRQPVLLETVRKAVVCAAECLPGVPLLAGGKSMGGRMTSLAAADADLPGVMGIVFLGFPLHPAGKPSVERSEHLYRVPQPMLFLQGTRDKLADLSLLQPVCKSLGPRITLQVFEGADHSFHLPRSTGNAGEAMHAQLAEAVAVWAETLPLNPA